MTAPVASLRGPARRRFQVIAVASVVVAVFGLILVAIGDSSNQLTLEGTGNGPINPRPGGTGVTNGGVASTGHFTVTGAVRDEGTYIDHRTVKGLIATVRKDLVGTKGTITIVITIHLDSGVPAPWTITSGTSSYAGLHGRGMLTVDNYQSNPYTFEMTGTVSR